MGSQNIIDHATPRYRAFHEAGHCAAAFLIGADVEFIELLPDGSGRCRVVHGINAEQAQCIAAAGYAVEFLLFKSGLLAAPEGKPPEKWFIDFSMANSWDDKKSFFGGDYSKGENAWPAGMDEQFMTFGWQVVSTMLRPWMPAIEALAIQLEATSRVTGAEARAIFAKHGLQ